MSDANSKRSELLASGDGPRVYTNLQVMEMLGIQRTTYSLLIKPDAQGRVLLGSSRLYPGGPRRHTQEQYNEYLNYLNGEGAVVRQTPPLTSADVQRMKEAAAVVRQTPPLTSADVQRMKEAAAVVRQTPHSPLHLASRKASQK